jgi:large conductance mechanosensitive channel
VSLVQDFKRFAIKGNAVDLAVGVAIGAAFNSIVTSLVDDIIMPPVSVLTGGIDFSDKKIVLKHGADAASTITLTYGQFINAVIDFLIIAFTIFVVIRLLNHWREDDKQPPAPHERECPYCYRKIPKQATRCPECTSKLEPTSA